MKLKKRIKRLEKRLGALERRMSAIAASIDSSEQLPVAAKQHETDLSKELASELERVRGKIEDFANEFGDGR